MSTEPINQIPSDVHLVWHEFKEHLDAYRRGDLLSLDETIAIFCDKYPNDFFRVGIDDASHSSSDLLFIVHKSDSEFFGTTVVVVPQNSGPPCTFFLYPTHMANLLQVSALINKITYPLF